MGLFDRRFTCRIPRSSAFFMGPTKAEYTPHPKRNVLIGRFLQLPRREYPDAVTVEQETDYHLRRIREIYSAVFLPILLDDHRRVQLLQNVQYRHGERPGRTPASTAVVDIFGLGASSCITSLPWSWKIASDKRGRFAQESLPPAETIK